jgi:hypothetical protein
MLEVTADDIAALDDDDLRALLALLCEAELRRRALPASAVTWGGHQDAADGGIDVRVELPAETLIEGFIPRAATGFQVKKPDMPAGAVKKEMRPNGSLRPSIQSLAANKGGYIIVSSTSSLTDTALADRRRAMAVAVADVPGGADLWLDFYDRTRMASWVREYPGLIPWVRRKAGRQIAGWQSYGPWASPDDAQDAEFLADDAIRIHTGALKDKSGLTAIAGIVRIRKAIATNGGTVRLVGLSGVGKTRLVQALFDSRIGEEGLDPALALYTNMSDGPDPAPVGMVSDLVVNKSRAIVVVDNCPPELHRRLTEVCKGSRVCVITVEYDIREDRPEGTEVFSLEPSSTEMAEKVLRRHFQDLSEIDARSITNFAGGNFRVALALANTVGRGESVSGLTDAQLFERLFRQRQEPDSALLQAGEACSLLYSFDGETVTGDSELARLGSLVGQSAPQLYARVAEMRRRDLVQTRSQWRAVLPHAIANRLAVLALQDIPVNIIEAELVTNAPERVKRSFSRRLGYLHDNEAAQRIVEGWLAPEGILSNPTTLDDLHAEMLTNVAPVVPEAVLAALEREARGRDGKLLRDKRRKFVRLLRSLAYDPALFERSANLLADFAVEDADKDKSEAGSALKSLFFVYLSGTHATLEQRIRVMESLVRSPHERRQQLGLEALRALLEAWHFMSAYDFEFGSRSRDFGYHPTFAELQAWCSTVLKSAEELANSDLPATAGVPGVVASAFRGLWTRAILYDDLEQISRTFASKGYWREGWIAICQTLNYGRRDLTAEGKARLIALEKELRPTDLVQKVRSIVLSSRGGGIGLDDYDECDEDPVKAYERTEALAKELGVEVTNNDSSFATILPEILSGTGKLFSFGMGLGSGAPDPANCWQSLRAGLAAIPAKRRNMQVLVGFLDELGRRSPELAASFLDESIADPILGLYFPMLQCAVAIGKPGVERLRKSLAHGIAPIEEYRRLAWGRCHETMTADDLRTLVTEIGRTPGGVEPALEIVFFRLFGDRQAKRDHEPEVIEAGRELIGRLEFERISDHDDHQLGLIVENCLSGIAGASAARVVCERFKAAASGLLLDVYKYDNFMTALCKTQPTMVLDTFFAVTEEKHKSASGMLRWSDGRRKNPIDAIPSDALIEWCDREPDSRYPSMADIVSFLKGSDEEEVTSHWSGVALRLIEHAPDPVAVVRAFVERFRPSSWSGSLASILEGRKALLEELKGHKNPDVAAFANVVANKLALEVEEERTWEAKHDRQRDERFE